jgi:hypothetical protein
MKMQPQTAAKRLSEITDGRAESIAYESSGRPDRPACSQCEVISVPILFHYTDCPSDQHRRLLLSVWSVACIIHQQVDASELL